MAETKKMNQMIGARIKAARKAKGMSQEQLADKLDVSFQAVSTWEKGKFIPLVLYGSYWYEPEISVSRFCGESVIKPDLSSDIVKSIPHFFVLGIKIK